MAEEKKRYQGMDDGTVVPKRKAISKSLRFEVFKRDNFRCQYCGETAPNVVLEVDHIVPVAEGGKTELINLITACMACNRGKGKRPLSSTQSLDKQRAQLEDLNSRREQLEMMVQWKRELTEITKSQADSICELISSLTGYHPTPEGKTKLNRLISRFGYEEVYESTKMSFERYFKDTSEWQAKRTWSLAFEKIGGVCYNRKVGRTWGTSDAKQNT